MVFASLFGGNGIFGRGGAGMSRVGGGEMWRESSCSRIAGLLLGALFRFGYELFLGVGPEVREW